MAAIAARGTPPGAWSSDPVGPIHQCANGRLDGKEASLLQSPNETRQHRERENQQGTKQTVGNTLIGMPNSEVHADMTNSPADSWATRVNLGRASGQRDQDQTDSGPNRLKSLTGGDESDSPTDEDRRAVKEQSANAKIENREPIYLHA